MIHVKRSAIEKIILECRTGKNDSISVAPSTSSVRGPGVGFHPSGCDVYLSTNDAHQFAMALLELVEQQQKEAARV